MYNCMLLLNHYLNLLHRHGVNEPRLSFSAISAENKSVEVWLHE